MSAEMLPPPSKEAAKPGESKKDEPPKIEGPKSETPKGKSETPKGDTAATALSADELAEIKKLPAEDQEPAIKQAVCPVSDEHLGSMEKPVKISAEGRTFFLCCHQCEKEVKSNPKAVIAKLDKK
jgi:YHS domain-containing protein